VRVMAGRDDDDDGPVPQIGAVGDAPEIREWTRRKYACGESAAGVLERDDEDRGQPGDEDTTCDRAHVEYRRCQHQQSAERQRGDPSGERPAPSAEAQELR